MAVSAIERDSFQHQRRLLTLPARTVTPAFLPTAAVLSIANRDRLRPWGWAPRDHHGVPWPSSPPANSCWPGPGAVFASSDASLIALAGALPRGGRSALLATG